MSSFPTEHRTIPAILTVWQSKSSRRSNGGVDAQNRGCPPVQRRDELERELEEINRRLTESTPRSGRVRVLWMRICAAAILVVGGTAATLLGVSGGVSLAFLVGFSSLAACAGLLGFARRLGAVAVAQNESRATNEEQRRRIAVQLTHRRKRG